MTMSNSLCIWLWGYGGYAYGPMALWLWLCLWPYGYHYGTYVYDPMPMALCLWPYSYTYGRGYAYAYSIQRMRRQKHRLQRWGIKRPQMAYLAPNSIFIVIVNINVTNYRAELKRTLSPYFRNLPLLHITIRLHLTSRLLKFMQWLARKQYVLCSW